MVVTETLALPGQVMTTTAWVLADVASVKLLRFRMGAADNSGSQRGHEDDEVAFHGGGWGSRYVLRRVDDENEKGGREASDKVMIKRS